MVQILLPMDIFQFSFNPYVFLPLSAMVIYAFLLVSLYPHRLSSKANGWFFAYLIMSLVSGFPTILMALSQTKMDAIVWQSLFFAIITFSFPMFVGFALHFTNHTKLISKLWFRVAMFVPAAIIAGLTLFTGVVSSHSVADIRYEHLMWIVPNGPLFEKTYIPHTMSTITGVGIFFAWHAFHIEDKRKKKQLKLFAYAVFFQIALDTFIVLIFPKIFHTFLIPDSLMMTFFLGAIIAWGILKYDLFTINPATVVTNIIGTMSEVLVVLNPEGNIEFVNKTTESVLGYAESDLVGTNMKNLVANEWSNFDKTIFNPILSGAAKVDLESSIKKKNGELLPVNFSASAIKDNSGGVVGIVCVATDITHLKELYDVTMERNKLSAIMESMSDGILALDKDGNVVQTNKAVFSWMEASEQDLLNKPLENAIPMQLPDGGILTFNQIREHSHAANGESEMKLRELKFTSKNGKVHYVEVSVKLLDKKQSQIQTILTLHDVTEEKELDEMKLDFVSMAAHELRTPLTSVNGYLATFMNDYGKNLDEDQTFLLGRVGTATDKLTDLVEDLLNVSKMESAGFKLDLKSQDWGEVVGKTLNDLNSLAQAKNVKINQIPSETLKITVDESRIREVLSNLLSNAIKYSDNGKEIKVWYEVKGGELITYVQDEGQGIPADAISRLFTKFYRVPGKLEQTTRGTGLGLYISKKIVDSHQGRIWVESEEGKGSTFAFSLPTNEMITRNALFAESKV
jgi:PAS domain S-box-containing protein